MPGTSNQDGGMETPRRLRREAKLANRDRSRLAALVAACTLTGVAVGFSLSALVTVHHAATMERGAVSVVQAGSQEPVSWLGVAIRDAGYDTRGAVVLDVFDGSPADRAGLEPGDRIVSVGGSCAAGARDVVRHIRSEDAGDTVTVGVVSGGEHEFVEPMLSSVPSGAIDRRATRYHRPVSAGAE